jgi:hypothetical protein
MLRLTSPYSILPNFSLATALNYNDKFPLLIEFRQLFEQLGGGTVKNFFIGKSEVERYTDAS